MAVSYKYYTFTILIFYKGPCKTQQRVFLQQWYSLDLCILFYGACFHNTAGVNMHISIFWTMHQDNKRTTQCSMKKYFKAILKLYLVKNPSNYQNNMFSAKGIIVQTELLVSIVQFHVASHFTVNCIFSNWPLSQYNHNKHFYGHSKPVRNINKNLWPTFHKSLLNENSKVAPNTKPMAYNGSCLELEPKYLCNRKPYSIQSFLKPFIFPVFPFIFQTMTKRMHTN